MLLGSSEIYFNFTESDSFSLLVDTDGGEALHVARHESGNVQVRKSTKLVELLPGLLPLLFDPRGAAGKGSRQDRRVVLGAVEERQAPPEGGSGRSWGWGPGGLEWERLGVTRWVNSNPQ